MGLAKKSRFRQVAAIIAVLTMLATLIPTAYLSGILSVNASADTTTTTTTWDFQLSTSRGSSVAVNVGTSKAQQEVKSNDTQKETLLVTTTSNGKFSNSAGDDRAQANKSTYIYVPVTASSSGTIVVETQKSDYVGGSGDTYYISADKIADTETDSPVKRDTSSNTITFTYDSNAIEALNGSGSYVKLSINVNNTYICSIKRNEGDTSETWSFKTTTDNATCSIINAGSATEAEPGVTSEAYSSKASLYVTGVKLFSGRDNAQLRDATIYIPVVGTGKITVDATSASSSLTVGNVTDSNSTSVTFSYDVANASTDTTSYETIGDQVYVKVVYSSTTDIYIKKITKEQTVASTEDGEDESKNNGSEESDETSNTTIAAGTYTFGTYANTDAVEAITGLSLNSVIWHDKQHGLNTSGGSITLSLSGKANITVLECAAYGYQEVTTTSGTVKAVNVTEGGTEDSTSGVAAEYIISSAAKGDVTLSFASGTAYIHSITVEYINEEESTGGSGSGDDAGETEAKNTRTVDYDFTANSDKNKPAVGSILDGTNTTTSGILYYNAGSGSGCTFDASVLRFRAGVVLYLPINDDTTKVTFSLTCSSTSSDRLTYIGSTGSGKSVSMSTTKQSITVDDITDYIVTEGGIKYLPIISGGDVKVTKITLEEYNPINTVTVSGTVDGAADAGVTAITFTNLDDTSAKSVIATVDSDGNYSTTLRRVAGNTNYAASIDKVGYKIDTADEANQFTLTGNSSKATQNFSVVAADVLNLSGSITGIDSSLVKGMLGVSFVPVDTSLSAVDATVTVSGTNAYTYSAILEAGLEYNVQLSNADDYEIADVVKKEAGNVSTDFAATLKSKATVSGSFITSDGKDAGVKSITFTMLDDNQETTDYSYTFNVSGSSYSVSLRAGEYQTSVVANDGYSAYDKVSVKDANVSNDVYIEIEEETKPVAFTSTITVPGDYATLTEAVAAINNMTDRPTGEDGRVTITLTDDLTEQVNMTASYVTLNGNGHTISWYYGIDTNYYSVDSNGLYSEKLAVDRYASNATNSHLWGSTFIVRGDNFIAEDTIFKNTYNYELTDLEKTDIAGTTLKVSRLTESADVAAYAYKERSNAFYIEADNIELYNCKVLSSQDAFGRNGKGESYHVYVRDCVIGGNVDYICGDFYAVFDHCELQWKTYSDTTGSSNASVGYIVAPKEPGMYVFRNCYVTVDDDSKEGVSGYLGRTWGDNSTASFINLETNGYINETGWTEMSSGQYDSAIFNEYNLTENGEAFSTSAAKHSDLDSVSDYIDSATVSAVTTVLNAASSTDRAAWTPVHYYDIDVDDSDESKVTVEANASTIVNDADGNYVDISAVELNLDELDASKDAETITKADEAIDAYAKSNAITIDATVAKKYIDLSITLKDDGETGTSSAKTVLKLANGKMKITLKLSGVNFSKDITVYHITDITKGEVEALTVTKNADEGSITFETTSFSPFVILYTASTGNDDTGESVKKPESESETPSSEETATGATTEADKTTTPSSSADKTTEASTEAESAASDATTTNQTTSSNVSTGDTMNMFGMIAVMAVCLAIISFIAVTKKRRA